MRRIKGFTLVELATTLAVAGVLVGMAAPGFQRLRSDWWLSSHTEALFVALHHARSSAITRGVPVSVCLRAAADQCTRAPAEPGSGWLVYVPHGASSAGYDADDELLQQQVLPHTLRVVANRTTITFWATTRSGTTATLTLCDDTRESSPRGIIISQTGRPRMSRVAADGGALSCAA